MGGSARRTSTTVRRHGAGRSGPCDRGAPDVGDVRSPRSPCPMRQEDPVATTHETDAMRRAIALSARALGATAPNPVVGCVILDTTGAVVGEGWHRKAGGPH